MPFTHIDQENNPTMVDISSKLSSTRSARAKTEVQLPPQVCQHFKKGEIHSPKGPVFQTAIIAGTMALKKTDQLIPFCHKIDVEACRITIAMEGECAVVECFAKAQGKTGVEMEALVGAQVAALTIYDMCKSFGYKIEIGRCRLLEKKGGKNDYCA